MLNFGISSLKMTSERSICSSHIHSLNQSGFVLELECALQLSNKGILGEGDSVNGSGCL